MPSSNLCSSKHRLMWRVTMLHLTTGWVVLQAGWRDELCTLQMFTSPIKMNLLEETYQLSSLGLWNANHVMCQWLTPFASQYCTYKRRNSNRLNVRSVHNIKGKPRPFSMHLIRMTVQISTWLATCLSSFVRSQPVAVTAAWSQQLGDRIKVTCSIIAVAQRTNSGGTTL